MYELPRFRVGRYFRLSLPQPTALYVLLIISLLVRFPRLAFAEDVQAEVPPPNPGFLARHLQILEVAQFNRFNYMDSGPGVVNARDMQYRIRTRTQINIAGDGATYLRMRAETGQGFSNSWNNIGGGFGPPKWDFYVKTLALGQKIGHDFELQGGGLEFDPGAGSQHTYASGDGAMVGYRAVSTGSPSAWRPDKFSLTMGYVGDFSQANFFVRSHMGKLNYTQVLAQKHLGQSGEVSAEFDSISNVSFAREAIHWQRGLGRVVDDSMVELVTRTNENPSFGWSATVSRGLDAAKRWQALAVYSDMRQGLYEKQGQPILLNQAEIGTGRRLSLGGSHALSPNMMLQLFAGRRLDNTASLRWVAQFGMSYQYTGLINHLLSR
jgi:hypothetical protein